MNMTTVEDLSHRRKERTENNNNKIKVTKDNSCPYMILYIKHIIFSYGGFYRSGGYFTILKNWFKILLKILNYYVNMYVY